MDTTYCRGVLMIDKNRPLTKDLIDRSYKRLIEILNKGGASKNRIINVKKCYLFLKKSELPPYQFTKNRLDNLSREMKSFYNDFNNTGNDSSKSYSYKHSKTMIYDPKSKKYKVVEKEQKNNEPVIIKKYLEN